MAMLKRRYADFHQHMPLVDPGSIGFYRKCGFERVGKIEPMWIYSVSDQ